MDREETGTVAVGTSAHATAAVDAAERAMSTPFPVPERAAVLARAAQILSQRYEEFARLITSELGKPITTPGRRCLGLVLHKVAPALAAGCAVVLKPSDHSPHVAGLLTELFQAAGLGPGWLNLITRPPAEIVGAWQNDERVAVISFRPRRRSSGDGQ